MMQERRRSEKTTPLKESLECLGIHELEERLEVSTLLPGGGSDTFGQGMQDCCSCKIGKPPLSPAEAFMGDDEWTP